MTRKMQELHVVGEKNFFEKIEHENRHPVFYSERLYTAPTNFELAKLTFNKVMEKCPEYYTETVAKIVRLRIARFDLQTNYLLENLKEEAWLACNHKK